MTRISVTEAERRLQELVDLAATGEEVVLTKDEEVVARLLPPSRAPRAHRQGGTLAGLIRMRDDFDDPLPGFEDLQ